MPITMTVATWATSTKTMVKCLDALTNTRD